MGAKERSSRVFLSRSPAKESAVRGAAIGAVTTAKRSKKKPDISFGSVSKVRPKKVREKNNTTGGIKKGIQKRGSENKSRHSWNKSVFITDII